MEKFCKFKSVISRGYLINYIISKSMDISTMCGETQIKLKINIDHFSHSFSLNCISNPKYWFCFSCVNIWPYFIYQSGWTIPNRVVTITYKIKPRGEEAVHAIHIIIMPDTYFIRFLTFPTSMRWLKKISASCMYLSAFSFIPFPVNLSDTFQKLILFSLNHAATLFPNHMNDFGITSNCAVFHLLPYY